MLGSKAKQKLMMPLIAGILCFSLSSSALAYEVNKREVKKWFKQHDYLFTDSFFNGSQWMQLSYNEKFQLVQDYYAENGLDLDVRKGLLTLDLMFNLDDGLYQDYSVYAILDKVIAEMFRDDTGPTFYSTITS